MTEGQLEQVAREAKARDPVLVPRATVERLLAVLAPYRDLYDERLCVCIDYEGLGLDLIGLGIVEGFEMRTSFPLRSHPVRCWIAARLVEELNRLPTSEEVDVVLDVAEARVLKLAVVADEDRDPHDGCEPEGRHRMPAAGISR